MESDPSVSFLIFGLIVTFLFSSFFSIIKVIFVSTNSSSASPDNNHLREYEKKIEEILEKRSQLAVTVSTGKIFFNALFAIFSFIFFERLFPRIPVYETAGIVFIFSAGISALFANEIPRAFALRFYRRYLPFCYFAYKILSWGLLPFTSLFILIHHRLLSILKYDKKYSFLTDEEKARITEPDDSEALDEEEKEMIRSIFDFGDTTVDQIMIPRIDIKGLEIDADLKTILKTIREEGHSRIPVFKETIDSITGILYAKDILSWLSENEPESWELSKILKNPHFIPVGKKVNELMREFKKDHIHIAIVVDEYGGTAGLVTMEDILEEIVGDIQDEYDEDEMEIMRLNDNEFLIDPRVDIHDLNDKLNLKLDIEDSDYNTLGGFIYDEYGDVPQENTSFDFQGIRFTVLKMDNQRIEKVKVKVIQYNGSPEIDSFN